MPGCGAISWSMINPPGITSLKKSDSLSPSSHQMSITFQLGVGAVCPSLIHVGRLTSSILWRSCAGNHRWCGFRSITACHVWRALALTVFLHLFRVLLSLGGRRYNIDIPCMAEHSTDELSVFESYFSSW